MVKNEVDIIETFVRYHCDVVDTLIIIDNGSSDGTLEILVRLREEGLPVLLQYDDRPPYDQAAITSAAANHVVRVFDPHILLFLDADEFVMSPVGAHPRTALEDCLAEADVCYLPWRTYVPRDDDPTEPNVLRRIRFRRQEEAVHVSKIALGRAVWKGKEIHVKQGNHDLESVDLREYRLDGKPNLAIAHFPVRSVEQAQSKYLMGWLANLARTEPILFDWFYFYTLMKQGSVMSSDLTRMAYSYNDTDRDRPVRLLADAVPLEWRAEIVCRYTPSSRPPILQSVLAYGELLARAYARARVGMPPEHQRVSQAFNVVSRCLLLKGDLGMTEAAILFGFARGDERCPAPIVCEAGAYGSGQISCVLQASVAARGGSLHSIRLDEEDPDSHHTRGGQAPANEMFDRILIHGRHSYEQAVRVFRDYSPRLRNGGVLGLHDVVDLESDGIRHMIEDEILGSPDWGEPRLDSRFFFVRRLAH